MIKPQRVNENSPYVLGFLAKAILFPFGLFYRLWLYSIRFKFASSSEESKVEELTEPGIIVLWHNRLFLAGEWQRRYRKNKKCYGLISRSKDGAWLETFYAWSGIHAVRGSSNRGGAKSIRSLVRKLQQGSDIGITPDGSKGPRYEAKPGCVMVARIAKSPMILVSFEYGWHIKLNSWDKFVIPAPFSKILVRTKILHIKDMIKDSSVEDLNELLNKDLMDITID